MYVFLILLFHNRDTIISNHKKLTYDQVWDALKQIDEDPNNPSDVILVHL